MTTPGTSVRPEDILSLVTVPVSYADTSLVYRFANRVAAEVIGLKPEDVVGRHMGEVLGARTPLLRLAEEVLETGEPRSAVVPMQKPGEPDELVLMAISYVADKDSEGGVRGVIMQGLDVTRSVREHIKAVTQREESEQRLSDALDRLRQNESLLEAIFEHSPSAVFVKDVKGRYVIANSRAGELWGLTREQMAGRSDFDLLPNDVAARMRYADEEVIRTGLPISREEEFVVDGRAYTFVTAKYPLRDEEGRLWGVAGISTDITDRVRSDERLKQIMRREALLGRLIELSSQPFAVASADGDLEMANDAFLDLVGYSADELKRFDQLGSSSMGMVDRAVVAQLKKTGEAQLYERELTSRDGRRLLVQVRLDVLRDDEGEEHYFGIVDDVSEQRTRERELLESEMRFRATFDQAAVGIAHVALDGHWIRVNRRLSEMFGYSESELGATTFMEITHPEDLEADVTHFELLVKGEMEHHSVEKRYRRKDGQYLWCLLTASLVRDPEGRPSYFVAVIQDIAERKRSEELEAALKHINNEVHSTLAIRKILKRVVVLACEALHVDMVRVMEREGNEWRTAFGHNVPARLANASFTDEEMPYYRAIAATRRAVAIRDAETDLRVHKEIMSRYGIRSALVTPLVSKGRVSGLLAFNMRRRPRSFSPAEVQFAEQVAASVSLALENARLYRSQQEVADTLQEALLTVPENVDDLTLAHRYYSAAEEARVGGDFYDILTLPGGKIGVVVGDVSGKGLGAAVLTSLVKNGIHAHAVDAGPRPSDVMHKINQVVYRETSPDTFVTVFFAILDTSTGRLSYCNAGHPSPLLRHADGRIEELRANSPIVGALDYVEYGDDATVLLPGDLLLLFTDGLTEARDRSGEFFGEEGALAFTRDLADVDPNFVLEELLDEVRSFSAGVLADDMAMLALLRREHSETQEP